MESEQIEKEISGNTFEMTYFNRPTKFQNDVYLAHDLVVYFNQCCSVCNLNWFIFSKVREIYMKWSDKTIEVLYNRVATRIGWRHRIVAIRSHFGRCTFRPSLALHSPNVTQVLPRGPDNVTLIASQTDVLENEPMRDSIFNNFRHLPTWLLKTSPTSRCFYSM